MKTFATVEEQNKAIEEFDERTSDLSELEEIMNAEVTAQTQTQTPSAGVDVDAAPPTEPKPDDSLPGDKPENQLIPDIPKPEGDDVVKEPEGSVQTPTIEELQAKLAEKESYIRENLSKMDDLRKLEEKVASLEKTHSEKANVSHEEVKFRESKLADLQERRADLLKRYPSAADQMDEDYLKEMNDIQNGLFEEMATMNHNMTLVNEQAKKAREKADSYISSTKERDAKVEAEKLAANQKQQVIEYANKNPQFKLSKDFDEVDNDYKNYQANVARTYLGRDPSSVSEINEAMLQLKRRSPGLISKLQVSGIPIEPSGDIKKYLALCEGWDHWEAYRKDPLTGKYNYDENGRVKQLTRYDPGSGKQVPDVFPSFEAAMNDKAVKENYYMKQIVAAKIAGAKDAMAAVTARETGATELGVNETNGSGPLTKEAALQKILQINEREAVIQAREGDSALLNEYNSLATTLEWPPVNI